MTAYFNMYRRKILAKTFTEEEIVAKVTHAYNLGLLTQAEYNTLVELIDKTYDE